MSGYYRRAPVRVPRRMQFFRSLGCPRRPSRTTSPRYGRKSSGGCRRRAPRACRRGELSARAQIFAPAIAIWRVHRSTRTRGAGRRDPQRLPRASAQLCFRSAAPCIFTHRVDSADVDDGSTIDVDPSEPLLRRASLRTPRQPFATIACLRSCESGIDEPERSVSLRSACAISGQGGRTDRHSRRQRRARQRPRAELLHG